MALSTWPAMNPVSLCGRLVNSFWVNPVSVGGTNSCNDFKPFVQQSNCITLSPSENESMKRIIVPLHVTTNHGNGSLESVTAVQDLWLHSPDPVVVSLDMLDFTYMYTHSVMYLERQIEFCYCVLLFYHCFQNENSQRQQKTFPSKWEVGEPPPLQMQHSITSSLCIREEAIGNMTDSGIRQWNILAPERLRNVAEQLKDDLKRKSETCRVSVQTSSKFALVPVPSQGRSSSRESPCEISTHMLRIKSLRNIFHRVLQLNAPTRLKSDSSNPSFISFLSCKCLQDKFDRYYEIIPIVYPEQFQTPSTPQAHSSQRSMQPGTVLYTSVPRMIPSDKIQPLLDKTQLLIKRGGNGSIFAGTISGMSVVVKKTHYRSKEFAILTKIQHRNIMTILAIILGEESPVFRRRYYCYHVMPRLTGDCARLLTDKEEFMMKYHIAHRDIKGSNILLKFFCSCNNPLECACDSKYKLVITDFDVAVELDYEDKLLPSSSSSHASQAQYHCVPVGTNGYRAPECAMHVVANSPDCFSPPVSTKCDLWSLGLLVHRMLVGCEGPYHQREMAILILRYHQVIGYVEGVSRWIRGCTLETVQLVCHWIASLFTGVSLQYIVQFCGKPLVLAYDAYQAGNLYDSDDTVVLTGLSTWSSSQTLPLTQLPSIGLHVQCELEADDSDTSKALLRGGGMSKFNGSGRKEDHPKLESWESYNSLWADLYQVGSHDFDAAVEVSGQSKLPMSDSSHSDPWLGWGTLAPTETCAGSFKPWLSNLQDSHIYQRYGIHTFGTAVLEAGDSHTECLFRGVVLSKFNGSSRNEDHSKLSASGTEGEDDDEEEVKEKKNDSGYITAPLSASEAAAGEQSDDEFLPPSPIQYDDTSLSSSSEQYETPEEELDILSWNAPPDSFSLSIEETLGADSRRSRFVASFAPLHKAGNVSSLDGGSYYFLQTDSQTVDSLASGMPPETNSVAIQSLEAECVEHHEFDSPPCPSEIQDVKPFKSLAG